MSSEPGIVDHIVECCGAAGDVSARKMFGEYGLFMQGRMVGVICDDLLFVRPTAAGRAMAPELAEKSPFPRAKPYLFVPEHRWDDTDWLAALLRTTCDQTPLPKSRAKRGPRKNAVARGGKP